MRIISVTILKQQPRGQMIKVTAEIIIEGNDLETYMVPVRLSVNKLADMDAALGSFAIVVAQKREKAQYVGAVRKGNNPFSRQPKFNTLNTLLRDILRRVFETDDPKDELLLGGSRLISNIPDAKLKSLFPSANDAKVAEIRSKATNLISARTALDSHRRIEL